MNPQESASTVITVSELNRRARERVESGFPMLWVAGEISNFTRAVSGHCYFSLKDSAAQVRCVFFRHKAAALDWKPENGMQVEVRALPTLYEARGDFQLTVEAMRRAGLGALFEAFERLKKKLELEGLFEAARKKPLPSFPRAIGVVTSPKAAALRDVLTTLERRMPGIAVVVYPTPVQGEGAGERIAAALRLASSRGETDVILLCRGGGSMEDLWSFNEEAVARAIVESRIPVVSGVGHETDFTIADFVADARAPTPTAAAELVSPDRTELLGQVRVAGLCLSRATGRLLEARMQKLDFLARRLVHPGEQMREKVRDLAHFASRLRAAAARVIDSAIWGIATVSRRMQSAGPDLDAREADLNELRLRLQSAHNRLLDLRGGRLAAAHASLAHLNPQSVLERGYSIVARTDGSIVRDAAQVSVGESLRLGFARGAALTRVERVEGED